MECDVRTLRNLCRDDVEACDLIDEVSKGRQGERTDLVDIINEVEPSKKPDGTSRDAALRRLRKDRLPDTQSTGYPQITRLQHSPAYGERKRDHKLRKQPVASHKPLLD